MLCRCLAGSRIENQLEAGDNISAKTTQNIKTMSEPLSPEFRAELRESLLGAIQDFFDEQLAPRAEGASAKRPRVTDRQLQLATACFFSR